MPQRVFVLLLVLSCACNKSDGATPPVEAEAPAPAVESDPATPPDQVSQADETVGTDPLAAFAPATPRQEELRGIATHAIESGDINLTIAAGIAMMETAEKSGLRASIMMMLGEIYFQEEEIDRSVAVFDRLIAESPEVGEFHFVYGRMLGELERFTEAEPHLRQAIEIRPHLIQAHLYLGSVLVALGREDETPPVYAAYEAALGELLSVAADGGAQLSARMETLELLMLAQPDDRITDEMIALLNDESLPVAASAVRVLATVGTMSAVPAIEAFAQRVSHPEVSAFAIQAVQQIQARGQ